MEANTEYCLTGIDQYEPNLLPIFPKKSQYQCEFSPAMEEKVVKLKLNCIRWREIMLPINSIFKWEKRWHPFGIAGCTTTFFMMLWLLSPTILTTMSLLGLFLSLCNYILPRMIKLLKSEAWTETKEEKYDIICRYIVLRRENVLIMYRSFSLMREHRPRLYYGISILGFLFLAWIGNIINNLLLTYIFITFICLLPGMERQGIIKKYGLNFGDKIADLAAGDIKRNN